MEKEIDVITLCQRITEMTNLEKCFWRETSENNRYKLNLKNGSIEILHFDPGIDFISTEYYEVSLFDNRGERYATYRGSSKGSSKGEEAFKVFYTLYKAIRNYLEKIRRRKMALLFDELEAPEEQK